MAPRIDTSEALKRIDSVIEYVREELKAANKNNLPFLSTDIFNTLNIRQISQLSLRLKQTLMDMSPHGSEYWDFADKIKHPFNDVSVARLYGALQSLQADYAGGHLQNFSELIDADLFEDILEQADYLRTRGFVRASAVVAGVALESHLRKLAEKNSISITNDGGKFVEAETLKNELYRKGIIDKTIS